MQENSWRRFLLASRLGYHSSFSFTGSSRIGCVKFQGPALLTPIVLRTGEPAVVWLLSSKLLTGSQAIIGECERAPSCCWHPPACRGPAVILGNSDEALLNCEGSAAAARM